MPKNQSHHVIKAFKPLIVFFTLLTHFDGLVSLSELSLEAATVASNLWLVCYLSGSGKHESVQNNSVDKRPSPWKLYPLAKIHLITNILLKYQLLYIFYKPLQYSGGIKKYIWEEPART